MSLRQRIRALEQKVGCSADRLVPIILDGNHDEEWRERAERARARGQRLRVCRFGVLQEASTIEEAEVLIARHRERHPRMPVTVRKRGTRGAEQLARWDPGVPAWLLRGGTNRRSS